MIGPCSYPAASLHHRHSLPTARAAELLPLAQGPALAPPGDHQGKGIKAPEHPFCPPDLLEQQGETEQGLRFNTPLCVESSREGTLQVERIPGFTRTEAPLRPQVSLSCAL